MPVHAVNKENEKREEKVDITKVWGILLMQN